MFRKNEEAVNLALCNTFGKVRSVSRAARNLPEGQTMKYVPYNSTGVIKISPELFKWLQKTRMLHSWNQKNHHATSMWGLKDIYKVLTAPNGHEFTMCQVIMSTKCSYDYITPLFFGVDVTPKGEVIVICSLAMKVEAESLLAHFGHYLAEIFGSVVWETFTFEYKLRMNCYQYYQIKNCAVEIDNSSLESDASITRECFKAGFTDDTLVRLYEVELYLPHQFTLHLCPDINGILGDENGDSATFNSNVSDATLVTSKTAPSKPIHYLVSAPTLPPTISASGNDVTPTIHMIDTTEKADEIKTSPPPKKSPKTSKEDTPDNRLEASSEN